MCGLFCGFSDDVVGAVAASVASAVAVGGAFMCGVGGGSGVAVALM